MKITFILPTAAIGGGVRVVFEYANRLIERGHKVKIIYPGKLFPKINFFWRLEAILRQIKYFFVYRVLNQSEASWFPLKAQVLRTPSLEERYIPDADIVVATANETADWVNKLPSRCGRKFYFIQGYETWSRDKEKVLKTYRMPMNKIVISSWLKQMVKKENQDNIYGPIINGVNFKQFYNKNKRFNRNKRILIMYSPLKIKGFADGLKAFNFVKKKHPEVKLVIFSAYPKNQEIPEFAEFHFRPSPNKLRELYATSDIFVSPSWQEGCQLPPMEAMACKTAVVATNVGGIPDYTIPGKTALVVPPKKPKLLAKAILELIEDDNKLKKISLAGYKHIRNFSWEKATKKLEKIFFKELKNA